MRTLDFSPFYRSTVGFDNLSSLLDTVNQLDKNQPSYPPYNIELLEEDRYRITTAVAGFEQDELSLEVEKQVLTISGKKEQSADSTTFLHRGIAGRNFERHFRLAEFVKVSNARLENGLLYVDLVREIPEMMKPRRIEIESGQARLVDLEKDQAA